MDVQVTETEYSLPDPLRRRLKELYSKYGREEIPQEDLADDACKGLIDQGLIDGNRITINGEIIAQMHG